MLKRLSEFYGGRSPTRVSSICILLESVIRLKHLFYPLLKLDLQHFLYLSSVEGMPTDNNLRQEDSVWNREESSDRVGGVIKRNRCYFYPVLDFETLHEANWLGSAILWNIEKLPS
ncbi:hypothetical protein MKW92_024323 [Papaver armeniacum]|nr:hypothetical protein MKW92_024323 [Papaver armeniacum]